MTNILWFTPKSHSGFAALSSVLILSAVVLTIALSVTLISVGTSQNSLALQQSMQAKTLVESCVEDVLFRIRADSNYAGTSVTLPTGTCTVAVSKAGSVYTLVISSVGTYVRTANVQATRTSSITINSWTIQ